MTTATEKEQRLKDKISEKVMTMVNSRKTLYLSSIDKNGHPYASYAPFAAGEDCIWVQLSEIAVHGINLKLNPNCGVLIVEDEDTAKEMFARKRVTYQLTAEHIEHGSDEYKTGIETLTARVGERAEKLSQMQDFKLFKLTPINGRYVMGFGQAYAFEGASLTGERTVHLTDGHKARA